MDEFEGASNYYQPLMWKRDEVEAVLKTADGFSV